MVTFWSSTCAACCPLNWRTYLRRYLYPTNQRSCSALHVSFLKCLCLSRNNSIETFLALIFLFYTVWMSNFSLKYTKKFKILSFRRNLIDLRSHSLLQIMILSYFCFDQLINNGFNEIFSPSLGSRGVFIVWWTIHLVEKIVFIFLKNIFILSDSYSKFPALFGYFENVFPDQPAPSSIRIGKRNVLHQRYSKIFFF